MSARKKKQSQGKKKQGQGKKKQDLHEKGTKRFSFVPFRTAVLRGLAVVLPPLLTIVIFLWVGGTVNKYFLNPVMSGTQWFLLQRYEDVRHEVPEAQLPPAERHRIKKLTGEERDTAVVTIHGKKYEPTGLGTYTPADMPADYVRLDNGDYVPSNVWYDKAVVRAFSDCPSEATGRAVYEVQLRSRFTFLQPIVSVPFYLSLFILVLYLLGKFMAAGIGRFFWGHFERGVDRVPLVRNVYGSVKQVSDFVLSEREIEYSRVVAIEWPRKGIWSLALVTGESMIDIEAAANEPVLSVLIPTSPMPMTGFTLTVKKSETVDLKISFDEAIQFIVSCGVVVPPSQMQHIEAETSEAETTRTERLPPPGAVDK